MRAVMDEVLVGKYRHMFEKSNLIRDEENAANNYTHGHYLINRDAKDNVMDRLRRLTEQYTG